MNNKQGIFTPKQKDVEFCEKCVYAASPWQIRFDYLCDYMEKTGRRRGCKPGVGCKIRKFKEKGKPT